MYLFFISKHYTQYHNTFKLFFVLLYIYMLRNMIVCVYYICVYLYYKIIQIY